MESLAPDILKSYVDIIAVHGGTTVLFAAIVYFLIKIASIHVAKYAQNVERDHIEKTRKIHAEIDQEENEKSLAKMRSVQLYLSNHAETLFSLGIDSVNVWMNHNGTRIGKFHFIFYSLIAEIVNDGAKSFGGDKIQPAKLPYYIFADYEQEISQNGYVFKHFEDLKGTSRAIAKDFGSKTVYGLPIKSIDGKRIDGIVFFTSVSKHLESIPAVEHIANDVRALLI